MFGFYRLARVRLWAALPLAALLAFGSARAALAVDYTIVDLGAPSSNDVLFYDGGNAYVNNSGQVLGRVDIGGSPYGTCIVYNSGKFIPLEKPDGLSCVPALEGLSDAGKSGSFYAVGQIQLPTVEPEIRGANNMFVAKVGGSSAKVQTYGQYSESIFDGINENGLAAGYTYYAPMSGWDGGIAALTQQNGGAIHYPLQPNCATGMASGAPCLQAPVNGVRTINKGGTILGYVTGQSNNGGIYAEVNASTGAVAGFQLPNWGNQVVGIDDNGDVVYVQSEGGVYSYDPATATASDIGSPSGCTSQFPAWVNGRGDVLASIGGCTPSSKSGWYLWTSSAGWSPMVFGSPPNGCGTPFYNLISQMNDKDQFALPMMCGSVTHWALLCPGASACGGSDATRRSSGGFHVRPAAGPGPAAYRASTSFPPKHPDFSAQLDRLLASGMPLGERLQATMGLAKPAGAETSARLPFARAAITYTIDDVGAPPSSLYSESNYHPIALNDTGQIVGQALPVSGFGRPTCLAWTGTAWVNFGPSDLAEYGCTPSVGITDMKSASFHSVGAMSYPTIVANNATIAYYATIGATSGSALPFTLNSPSGLSDMNSGGTAVGFTYYAPFAGWYADIAAVSTTGKKLKLIQKKCAAGGSNCMYAPGFVNVPCDAYFNADGVRSINATGVVFGCAAASSGWVEVKGKKVVAFSLPLGSGNGLGGVSGIDDAGHVIYGQVAGGSTDTAWSYNPATGNATNLGSLAGTGCTEYAPLAVNGPGEVLGYADNCSVGSFYYWTWSSSGGMQQVTISGSDRFTAYWLNDDGQILVSLSGSGFSGHWATLNPSGSQVRGPRNAFGSGSLHGLRTR